MSRRRLTSLTPSNQKRLTGMGPYGTGSEKHQQLTDIVTRFITSGMVPIYTVQKPSFQQMLKAFDPRYNLPSRNYFSKTAIPTAYSAAVSSLKQELKSIRYVSLTTDGWSSTCRDPYLSLTAHFINSDWTLQTKCLHTMYCPDSHTGENIANFVRSAVSEYGLSVDSVMSVTTDGAANMVSACRKLQVTRIGCFGHLLHNAITNALSGEQRINNILVLARKIVSVFSYSFQYRQKLTKVQKELGLPQQALVNDVATRWGSKYKMLERLKIQLPAVSQLFVDGEYSLVVYIMCNCVAAIL